MVEKNPKKRFSCAITNESLKQANERVQWKLKLYNEASKGFYGELVLYGVLFTFE
jgi:hypothetical protein